MTTLTASSSRPADFAFAVAATLVAVTLFLVGWGVLHRGFFADRTDRRYADVRAVRLGDERREGSVPGLRGRVPARRAAGLRDPGTRQSQLRDVPDPLRGADGVLRPGDDRLRGGRARRARCQPAPAAHGARLRRSGAGSARSGRPVAVRPLARRAHGCGALRSGHRSASTRARGPRRGDRGQALPGRARALDGRLRLAPPGEAGSAALCRAHARSRRRRLRALRRRCARRRLGQPPEPGLAPASDRERSAPGSCWSPTTSSGPGSRWRRATARRTWPGRRRRCWPCCRRSSRPRRSSRRGSSSRAGRRPGSGSSTRAPPPLSPSSRSGRCFRRSS